MRARSPFVACAGALAAMLVGLLVVVAPARAQRTAITAYTAMENDQLATFKAAIEKAVPDVEVRWVRDSTGVITARLLAEKAAPKADLVLGLPASSLLILAREGLIEPYRAAGSERHRALLRSPDGLYVGMDAFLAVICANTVEGARAGAGIPRSARDLLQPALKGKVVMPHPASSGTGYLIVATWLQTMGEAQAWAFMDALHGQIAHYVHSGSAPCVQAARGEHAVGLGFDMRALREKAMGAPLEIVLPQEGAGWDMEVSALVTGSPRAGLARRVLDWAASPAANALYARYYGIVADPDVTAAPAGYPVDAASRMAPIDLKRMADERDAIVREWVRRYESGTRKP